jgi:ribosomal protein S7
MVKLHMSERRYSLLLKYDHLLCNRREKSLYYMFFLFFSRDYFVSKIVTKLMRRGRKDLALKTLKGALFLLKQLLGFQPFFFFKQIAFNMRQLFKIRKVLLRQTKSTYYPMLLKPHNQVTYGINHLIRSSKDIVLFEKRTMKESLCYVLFNCFIHI